MKARNLSFPVIFVLLLSIMLVVGLTTGAGALALPSVLCWTPAIFWLGWAAARAGITLRSPVQLPSRDFDR